MSLQQNAVFSKKNSFICVQGPQIERREKRDIGEEKIKILRKRDEKSNKVADIQD